MRSPLFIPGGGYQNSGGTCDVGRRAPSIQESYREDVLLNVSLRRSLNALYIMLLVFRQPSRIKSGDGVSFFFLGVIAVMIAGPFLC